MCQSSITRISVVGKLFDFWLPLDIKTPSRSSWDEESPGRSKWDIESSIRYSERKERR